MKHNFGYFFKEGTHSMFSHGFMTFAAIGITVACLIIMGTFTLIAINVDTNLQDVEEENAVVAFVDDNYAESKAKSLQSSIEAVPNVKDATFVSREEARDAYVKTYDENDLYKDIDSSVFRHRYVIHLLDQSLTTETKEALEQVPGIAKVRADEALSTGFVTLSNVVSVISIALIAILLVVSLFIISNTIKLTTYDRKEEIAIMRMVGATNSFIRWPFVFEGLLIGLFSGVIGFGLQWLLYYALQSSITANDSLQLLHIIDFKLLWYYVAAIFGATGILVGILGSLMAIRKFLKV